MKGLMRFCPTHTPVVKAQLSACSKCRDLEDKGEPCDWCEKTILRLVRGCKECKQIEHLTEGNGLTLQFSEPWEGLKRFVEGGR